MTDDELNEAVAKALGWQKVTMVGAETLSYWNNPVNGDTGIFNLPWATSTDACLRDLLPVVREKGLSCAFEECWAQSDEGIEAHWFWYVGVYRKNTQTHHSEDPTLSRAICLVFKEMMEGKP